MNDLIVKDMGEDAHALVAEIVEADRVVEIARKNLIKLKKELMNELGLPNNGDKVRLLLKPPSWKEDQTPQEHLAFVRWRGTTSGTLPGFIFSKVKKDGTESMHRLYIYDEYEILEIL